MLEPDILVMIMLIVSDMWQYIPPTSCSVLGVSTLNVVLLSSGPYVLWCPVNSTVFWVLCFGVGVWSVQNCLVFMSAGTDWPLLAQV